jgi:hypothetical protein
VPDDCPADHGDGDRARHGIRAARWNGGGVNGQGTPREQARRPDGLGATPPGPQVNAQGGPSWPVQQTALPVLGAPPPAITPTGAAHGTPVPATPARPVPSAPVSLPPGQSQPQAAPVADTSATSRIVGEPGGTLLLGGDTGQAGGVGQGSAVAQAAATAVAVRSPTGAGSGLVPPGPDHGTIYGGENGPRDDHHMRLADRVRPLPALRIGSHLASDAAMDEIRFSTLGVGILLGHDRDRRPVQVRMFRPESTRLTLVGGLWGSRLLAFRALALGARVVIFTRRPEQWGGFGQWATGRSDRVAVMAEERPVTVATSPLAPALLIYDMGLLGAARRPELGPWQTQLTVLHQLTAYGFPAVQESSMVMMQRLGNEEAVSLGSVLRLTGEATQLLTALRDDMFALVGGGADRYVWVNPTEVEKQRFGTPHR